MRIAIDARYLSHGLVGGVHTYTRNLVDALLRQDRTNDYVLWADAKAEFEIPNLPANAELRTLPWRGAVSSVKNDRMIGTAMLRGGADIAHFPANFGFAPDWMPRVITLHDAINVLPLAEIVRGHRKDARTILTMSYLHAMTRKALQGSPTVITVSEYSRREILKHTQLDPAQVRVVYSAPEPIFRRLPDEDVRAYARQIGARELVVLADGIKNPQSVLRGISRAAARTTRAREPRLLRASSACPGGCRIRRTRREHPLVAPPDRGSRATVQPCPRLRLPLPLRGIRAAGTGGDGLRDRGDHLRSWVAAGSRWRRRNGRWSGRLSCALPGRSRASWETTPTPRGWVPPGWSGRRASPGTRLPAAS